MKTRAVQVRAADGVQVWRMENEPVNAINPELVDVLDALQAAAEADPSTSVVVLTSGLTVFSAGADATWIASVVRDEGIEALIEHFVLTMDRFRRLCERMRRSPLLFIAAINGHALAGGLELAAACDLRYLADNDKLRLGVPEMDLFGAMPSGGGGVQFLTRLMPRSRALHFVLDAKPINPRDAYAIGLADRLVPADTVADEAEQFARSVAAKAGRIGIAAAKRSILTGGELPLYEALEFDRALHWDALRRGNFRAGVQSFVDRFGGSGRGE